MKIRFNILYQLFDKCTKTTLADVRFYYLEKRLMMSDVFKMWEREVTVLSIYSYNKYVTIDDVPDVERVYVIKIM